MKRLVALLLILCLTLCGCGKSAEVPTDPTEETQPVVEATEPEPTEPEPTEEPTEPEPEFRHPLTGEPMDGPMTNRIVASTINNVKKALPQHGISQADFFYELECEGAATRGLALFSDLSDVGPIGSVRSARTYFNSIMASYDGILVHTGSSKQARAGQYDLEGNRGEQYDHIDFITLAGVSYRDQDRINAGYAYEHTMFTDGERLTKALNEKVDFPVSKEEGYDFGLTFHEEPGISGETAENVVITFAGSKTTTMTRNAQTGLYEASQFEQPWIDANTETAMAFRNLFVLTADRRRPEGKNSFYTLTGSGEGWFACDGQIVPIQWHRETFQDPFSYTLTDGSPVTLGVGSSYVAIVTADATISYS